MTTSYYDGFTADEQFFSSPAIVDYTEAVRFLKNPENRLIYTWIVGKPALPGIHTDFISASLNARRVVAVFSSRSTATRPNEQDATELPNDRLIDTMKRR